MLQYLKLRFAQAGMAIALLCLPGRGTGQVLVPPSTPDIAWYSQGWYIEGINTAMINYGTSPNPQLLAVSDYFGNGMAGGVVFRDMISGFTQKVDYAGPPPIGYINVSPDIIVGNSLTSPGNQFIAAAAYITLGGNPQVDFWKITYTSPGIFTVAPAGSMAFSGFASQCVHIDIMAASSNTGLTGHPLCDTFVVTWDNFLPGGGFTSYSFPSTLSAPYGGVILSTTPGVHAMLNAAEPDVAAVQRQACPTCPMEDWALTTYRNSAGNVLYLDEWNINTGLATTSAIYLGIVSSSVGVPRIDAPDDYNVNSPAIPGRSYYKVTADLNGDAYTFDNQLGIAGWNCTSYMGAPKVKTPAIAYGGNGGTQYTVAEYTYATPNVYMQPIDWGIPTSLALSPSLAYDYFLVNTKPIIFINGFYLTSVSTPCNDPGIATLVAWSNNDNTIPLSTVYYKLTRYAPPNGYTFRPGPAEAQPTIAAVYPNPAATHITLAGASEGGSYAVVDMLGQTALSGMVSGTAQQVDVSALAPGVYVVSAVKDGAVTLKATFVKE